MRKHLNLRCNIALGLIVAFLLNTFGPLPSAQAQEFRLPAPGVMVYLSPEFNPPILKGINVHPDNPFHFDFILDQGDGVIASEAKQSQQEQLKQEATKLIKYFLASLTIPEKDLWVNLSPYEKDHIIPNSFGLTEMGRDLLAEDYMLKQITASLIYPEGETGKKFWKRIYEEAAKKFGTTNIPVNTFNKVWIVPEKAVVYENAKAGTAYVVESKLKVMLEQDYLSMTKHENVGVTEGGASPASAGFGEHAGETRGQDPNISKLGSDVIRAIVIPELTKEVNEGKNFSQLRQVYNSLILAAWYKKKIKDSILDQVYADKKKVAGVGYEKSVILSAAKDLKTPLDSSPSAQNDTELIYQRYLAAFKKGVYNYIKEDIDPSTQETVPRKYFSGGFDAELISPMLNFVQASQVPQSLGAGKAQIITVDCTMANDQAMKTGNGVQSAGTRPNTSGDAAMLNRLALEGNLREVNGIIDQLQANPEYYGSLLISEFEKTERISVGEYDSSYSVDSNHIESNGQKQFIQMIDAILSGDGVAANTLLGLLIKGQSFYFLIKPFTLEKPRDAADGKDIFEIHTNVKMQNFWGFEFFDSDKQKLNIPTAKQARNMILQFAEALKREAGLINYDVHHPDWYQLWNEAITKPEVQGLGSMGHWLVILGEALRFQDGRFQKFLIEDRQLTREAKETIILKCLVLAKEGKSATEIVSRVFDGIIPLFKHSEGVYGFLGSGGWESEVHKVYPSDHLVAQALFFKFRGLGFVYKTILGMPFDPTFNSTYDYIEYVGRPALSWQVQNEKIDALLQLGFLPLKDPDGRKIFNDLQYSGIVPGILLEDIEQDRESMETQPQRWKKWDKDSQSIGLAPAESEYIDFVKLLLYVSKERSGYFRRWHDSIMLRPAIRVPLPNSLSYTSSGPGVARLQYPRGDVSTLPYSDFRKQNHMMQVLHGAMIYYLMRKHNKIAFIGPERQHLAGALADLFEEFIDGVNAILRKHKTNHSKLGLAYLSNDWGDKVRVQKGRMLNRILGLKGTGTEKDLRDFVERILVKADFLLVSAYDKTQSGDRAMTSLADLLLGTLKDETKRSSSRRIQEIYNELSTTGIDADASLAEMDGLLGKNLARLQQYSLVNALLETRQFGVSHGMQGPFNFQRLTKVIDDMLIKYEARLAQMFAGVNTYGGLEQIARFAMDISGIRRGMFVKDEQLKKILMINPPVQLMEMYGVRSVEELLEKISVREAFSHARYIEGEAWTEKNRRLILRLTQKDLEIRDIEIVMFKNASEGTKKFFAQKLPFSQDKIAGTFTGYPMDVNDNNKVPYLRALTRALHYLYELRFYSNFIQARVQDRVEDGRDFGHAVADGLGELKVTDEFFEPHALAEVLFMQEALMTLSHSPKARFPEELQGLPFTLMLQDDQGIHLTSIIDRITSLSKSNQSDLHARRGLRLELLNVYFGNINVVQHALSLLYLSPSLFYEIIQRGFNPQQLIPIDVSERTSSYNKDVEEYAALAAQGATPASHTIPLKDFIKYFMKKHYRQDWSERIDFSFGDSLSLYFTGQTPAQYQEIVEDLEAILGELIPNAFQAQKEGHIKIVVQNNRISIKNRGKINWQAIKERYHELIDKNELYVSRKEDGSIEELAYKTFVPQVLIDLQSYDLATQKEVDNLFKTPTGRDTLLLSSRGISFAKDENASAQVNTGLGLFMIKGYGKKLGGEFKLADDGKGSGEVSFEIEFSNETPFAFIDQTVRTRDSAQLALQSAGQTAVLTSHGVETFEANFKNTVFKVEIIYGQEDKKFFQFYRKEDDAHVGFIYTEPTRYNHDGEQAAIKGMEVEPRFRGDGMARFMVSTLLGYEPEIKYTHPQLRNAVLMRILVKDFGFSTSSIAEPDAYYIEGDGLNRPEIQRLALVPGTISERKRVFISENNFSSLVKGWGAEVEDQYVVTSRPLDTLAHMPSVTPLYLGYILKRGRVMKVESRAQLVHADRAMAAKYNDDLYGDKIDPKSAWYSAWFNGIAGEFESRLASVKSQTDTPALEAYLRLGNDPVLAKEAYTKIQMALKHGQRLIIEIGSGDTNNAVALAQMNPQALVLAADEYDNSPQAGLSYVGDAMKFESGRLASQKAGLGNLITIRSRVDIMSYLPNASTEGLVLVKPSFFVLKDLIVMVQRFDVLKKFAPAAQIAVLIDKLGRKYLDPLEILKFDQQKNSIFKNIDLHAHSFWKGPDGLYVAAVPGMMSTDRAMKVDEYSSIIEDWSRGDNREAFVTASDGTIFTFRHQLNKRNLRMIEHRIKVLLRNKEVGYLDFVTLSHPKGNRAWMDTKHGSIYQAPAILVRPDITRAFQGRYKGVGRSLMGLAERLAFLDGAVYFYAEGVGAGNFSNFYAGLGFKDSDPSIPYDVHQMVFKILDPNNFSKISILQDQSMKTEGPKRGGIDLTPANLNLQTRMDSRGGEGIKFHLDPAMLEQLRNAPGFVPVIINVQPLTDLRKFLGIASPAQ